MSHTTMQAPPPRHLDRQLALYSVEVSNGLRTVDVSVVADCAMDAMVQGEKNVNLATDGSYHYTGKFALATLH